MPEDDVENDIEREAIRKQQKKSELEQRAAAALNGGPELRRAEKNKFLGEFRERVLIALTFKQVEEAGTYRRVLEAIKDSEAVKLIIDRGVEMAKARDYIKLAQKNDLKIDRNFISGWRPRSLSDLAKSTANSSDLARFRALFR